MDQFKICKKICFYHTGVGPDDGVFHGHGRPDEGGGDEGRDGVDDEERDDVVVNVLVVGKNRRCRPVGSSG